MPSASLSFNIPLFKKQTKRFWSLWAVYSLWLFISMPVVLYIKAEPPRAMGNLFSDFENHISNMAGDSAVWLQFGFCLLFAMALWSYLYNNRSVSMLHALPITRGTHFLTNYITGLAFSIVPSLVIFAVSLCVQAANGTVTLQAMGFWLLSQVLTSVFFFSFATLLAFVAGSIFTLPVIYVVFSIMAKALVTLVDGIFASFVYGYAGNWGALSWIGEMLSPIYTLGVRGMYGFERAVSADGTMGVYKVFGLNILIAYAIAGLVMAVLAYLLYRRRSLELCGEVVAVSFLRPVFKYGFTLCVSLTGGMALYAIFSESISQGIGNMLFLLLIWAAIGYFVAEMLLRKSAKIFRKSMPGCIASLLIITAVVLGMEYDITGYERYIPEDDQVVSVCFDGRIQTQFQAPGDIASARALHRTLVEQKDEIERANKDYMDRHQYAYATGAEEQTLYDVPITISYQLENGQEVRRSYRVISSRKSPADAASPIARYDALLNTAQAVMERTFPEALGEAQPKSVDLHLTNYKANPLPPAVGIDAPIDGNYTDADTVTVTLSGEVARGLYAAMRADITAGRAGKTVLVEYDAAEEERIYARPLYFTFTDIYNGEDAKSISERYDSSYRIAYGNFGWSQGRRADGTIGMDYEASVQITKDATETIAFLKTLGIQPELHLYTYAQANAPRYADETEQTEVEAEMQTENMENLP